MSPIPVSKFHVLLNLIEANTSPLLMVPFKSTLPDWLILANPNLAVTKMDTGLSFLSVGEWFVQ
ncbi:MAG: hypothetical protein M0D53_02300 [Flavobacterium sp. JAD_PAG50586_2]|nr:MAG: hypothetical protein M0D53_02300 [Flavobacterium sp. JAD_PAG50586_2]